MVKTQPIHLSVKIYIIHVYLEIWLVMGRRNLFYSLFFFLVTKLDRHITCTSMSYKLNSNSRLLRPCGYYLLWILKSPILITCDEPQVYRSRTYTSYICIGMQIINIISDGPGIEEQAVPHGEPPSLHLTWMPLEWARLSQSPRLCLREWHLEQMKIVSISHNLYQGAVFVK